MNTRTQTLAKFLLARIDEDEAAAREATVVIGDDLAEHRIAEWWDKPEHGRVYAGHWHKVVQAGVTTGERPFHNAAALPHIARHDPARILADCEAKRRIVEMQRENDDLRHQPGFHYKAQAIETVLRALALPYADHPDYRDMWRPRA